MSVPAECPQFLPNNARIRANVLKLAHNCALIKTGETDAHVIFMLDFRSWLQYLRGEFALARSHSFITQDSRNRCSG